MERKNWSREELILAFNLYLKLQFGQMHSNNLDVKYLAKLIGRTPASIAMRLGNFAAVDPFHQKRGIRGLSGGIRQCQPIFDEFTNNREDLMFASEKILAHFEGLQIEDKFKSELIDLKGYSGKTKDRIVKTRVNQNLFRKIVLTAYSNTCAISGLNIPQLLVASHIKRWADDEENRLNPSNGLSLNTFYDAAFDKGYIGIDLNYKVVLSEKIKTYNQEEFYIKYFKSIENNIIKLPDRFLPDKEFLRFHLNTYFDK